MSKYVKFGFLAIVLVYAIFRVVLFMGVSVGAGDEQLFISDLTLIKTDGWLFAIKKGVSIPYMLLVYPLSFVFESYLALRLVNVILLLGLFFYFFKVKRISNIDFHTILLFFLCTVGFVFRGTNDALFMVGLVVFFSETFFAVSKSYRFNQSAWALGLIIAFFTRELFIIFLPVILFSVFIIRKELSFNLKAFSGPLLLLLVFFSLNVPSIISNQRLSYDDKVPPKDVTANWAQRQYLAQLKVNSGDLKNNNHPTWEETDDYLAVNGEASLPDGILKGLYFDVGLTAKEFVKDLWNIIIYSSRQLGLVLAIILGYALFHIYKRKPNLISYLYIPFLIVVMSSIFAFIIISFVELRWLASIFITAILGYLYLIESNKLTVSIVNLNRLSFIILGCYGIFKFLF